MTDAVAAIMATDLSAWDEIRRIEDELELKIHLGGMDARDRWLELQPRLVELEKAIVHSGEQIGETVAHELDEVRTALRRLRDDVYAHARADYVTGW